MRAFIASLVLLLVISCGLAFYSGFLNRESQALLSVLDELFDAARGEDWARADAFMEKTDKLIEEKTPHLALFTNHDILDEIMESAAKAKGYAESREAPELVAEIETLRAMISHIPKREALSLYNIF